MNQHIYYRKRKIDVILSEAKNPILWIVLNKVKDLILLREK